MKKSYIKLVADFETTVEENTEKQTKTEVWSCAITEIGNTNPDNVTVYNSIDQFFEYLLHLKTNAMIYFHNLSFDGSFILHWLLSHKDWTHAFDEVDGTMLPVPTKDMKHKSFKYTISTEGQWYNMTLCVNHNIIHIYDSYKLLPLSVANIGKSFKTKHQKLTMEYVGNRYAGCEITDEELAYIKNDVLVMSESLAQFFAQGHNGTTIGSCCLKEFQSIITKTFFKEYFPNLGEIEIPDELKIDEWTTNADTFIRKSYKGGWCYVAEGKEGRVFKNGITADVNSLYPSVMSGESGNPYPVGRPYFWVGNEIPQNVINNRYYYFIRVKTEFRIRRGYLPTIQIKGNPFYPPTKWLTTSDIYNKKTGTYVNVYVDEFGEEHRSQVDMVVSMTDWEMMNKHYILYNTQIIGGCAFATEIGLFDEYINKWRKVKENSKDGMRTIAKLFLNNLYGKLSANENSSYKWAYLNDENALAYKGQQAFDKELVSIACGAAVTSYARAFTITAAQANYHGKQKRGFIYADTDSIHCDLSADEVKGIECDNNAFLKWKLESYWDKAIFARQKTYIEHVTHENGESIEEPFYLIKAAGMGKRCKDLLNLSLQGKTEIENMTEEEKDFLATKREMTDLKVGLKIPSKLVAKNIDGGILLKNTTFELH